MTTPSSSLAFAFSFLTLAIYWMNHDRIGRLLVRHDDRLRYLNLFLLFWICLVPFVTAFIGEYPTSVGGDTRSRSWAAPSSTAWRSGPLR